jgi:hypothetical protein
MRRDIESKMMKICLYRGDFTAGWRRPKAGGFSRQYERLIAKQ